MFGPLKRDFRSMASQLYLQGMLLANLTEKNTRHRAVSLRQHGCLVLITTITINLCRFHYLFTLFQTVVVFKLFAVFYLKFICIIYLF